MKVVSQIALLKSQHEAITGRTFHLCCLLSRQRPTKSHVTDCLSRNQNCHVNKPKKLLKKVPNRFSSFRGSGYETNRTILSIKLDSPKIKYVLPAEVLFVFSGIT